MDKHKASKERRSQYHHKSSVWSRLGDKKAGTQSKYHQKSVWTRLGDTKRVELTSTASTSSSSSSSRNYSTGNYQNRKRTHSNDTSNERHSHYLSKRKRTHENNFSPESYNSKPQFGYKRLEGLTKISSNEVVTILANRDTGFKELLIDKLRPDFIHLIVRTLAKVSEADFNENKTFILTMACQQDFLNQLLQHIISISIEGRKSDFEDFLSALLKFLKTVLELLPNYASDRFQKILRSTDMTINGMTTYHNVSVSTNLKEEFNCLQVQLNNLMEDKEKQANSRNESKPPDDFRKISVYPTPDEILTKKLPFLRPNKTKGAYSDVENYLDIQFRLLREDFVCPLREGIMNYLHSKPTKKNNRVHNVRIYKNVTFKSMKVTSNKIGVLVNFDPNFKNKKISWINSKRFMFGSLLCFTDDDFRSIILATVIDRDIKLLKSGLVLVELCAGTHISESLFNHSYTMAESEVYFEPYFHVLKGLQAMTEDKFPLKKYIVDVDCTDSTPQYLLVQKNVKYKLSHEPSYSPSSPTYTPTSPTYTPASPSHSPSLPSCSTYSTSSTVAQSSNSVDKSEVPNMRDAKIKSNALEDVASTPKLTPVLNFTVLDFDSWPSAEQLSLDGSQYNAFRSALTREFVVIQGPPGTGKTHLGLKMTEVLLNNSSVWKSTDRPILVVCYTNHALDQFLEGLLCTTEELVRVGGQSKSEYLRKFNLNQKRHLEVRKFACTQLSLSIKREMENYVRCLKEIELDLEILNKYSGIVSLHSLKSIMRREHYDFFISLSESVEKVDEAFIGWLMENDLDFSTENEKSTFEFDSTEKLENMEVDLELHDDERKSLETLFSDIDVDFTEVNARLQMSVTIENLEKWLAVICEMQKQKQEDASVFYMLEMESNTVRKTLKCLKYHLQRLKSRLRMSFAYLKSEENLLSLRIEQRWNLYSYWLQLLQKSLLNETENINKKFHKEAKRYEEVKHKEDLVILKKALVVGMTTSGAARLQPLLQALRPPIVIVEEAAEVLEAHIITALTKHCQHLILIGDHKQLKPSTAVYKLSRKFNLDTSLFERMVSNGMHCETLKVQHRMRPEIARLIVPSIYPDLRNHNSVLSFPKIRGVVKNLFFVTHDIPEEEMLVEDSTLRDVRVTVVDNFQGEENDIILLSLVRSNDEGKIGFLTTENRVCVALSRARHGLFLIGNMENLKNASAVWKNIEETLSQQDAIGTHLKLQCEIHPDQQTLVSCAEDFSKVPEGGCTVQCMASLRCGHTCKSLCHINDRDHTVHRCYEPCKLTCELKHPCKLQCWQECGICKEPVLRNLPCGHEKELQCYIEYQAYECQVPVLRKLPCDHEKELECYVEYQTHICQVPVLRKLPCGHEMELECFVQYQMHKCQVKVLKKLSACGHEVTAECWMKEENIRCSFPCEIRLDCGHACTRRCHPFRDPDHEKYICLKPCTRDNVDCINNHKCSRRCYEECMKCNIKVEKLLPKCGHTQTMNCSTKPEEFSCKILCTKELSCGHKCPLTCGEECGGCKVLVPKVIPECGHEVKTQCSKEAVRKQCKSSKCESLLACGHNCKERCSEPCTSQCEEMVNHKIASDCGHIFKIPCFSLKECENVERLQRYCNVPCDTVLECGHQCSGTCYGCYQGRVHMECIMPCGKPLVCGHRCETPCAKRCPPCMQECNYRCVHSRCGRKCGQPCIPCREPCAWRCKHYRCTRKCFEICNRQPCNEPCTKELRCGHPCIGFCGEKCPKLCRICDPEEVTKIFLGHEDEEDARFVLLEDCGHSIEAKGLEEWLNIHDDQKDIQIETKVCPLCKTPINRTQRFMNVVKAQYNDVLTIKRRVFGDVAAIRRKEEALVRKLNSRSFYTGPEEISDLYVKMLRILNDALYAQRSKTFLNYCEVEKLEIQTDVLCEIDEAIQKLGIRGVFLSCETKNKVDKRIHFLLWICKRREIERGDLYTSEQEVADLNLELQRFKRIIQLFALENTANFENMRTENVTNLQQKVTQLAFSMKRYSKDTDKILESDLKALKEALKSTLNITETERKLIVKAIGLKQGHWYKCPNGHIYVITECGGAMQEAKCNECKAKIGGTNHRLLFSNRLAQEMDGATHSAWSEAANMRNYHW
ncbi:NFX1-type zinc finger-containing protein 1-like isoform X2 [Periplaneta americana]|uniref:NFX1-type zinc finger-containing protein 1-like isoform X2 n=1 Tax=Periplaneta americana TaxID=6978 RepID=UPI0037E8CB90